MSYHAEFGLFSPNGVGITRGTPKIGSLWTWVPPLGTEGVPDPYKHAAPHVGREGRGEEGRGRGIIRDDIQ